jgi:hypothetical protein
MPHKNRKFEIIKNSGSSGLGAAVCTLKQTYPDLEVGKQGDGDGVRNMRLL